MWPIVKIEGQFRDTRALTPLKAHLGREKEDRGGVKFVKKNMQGRSGA